jgi:hypothetical protein
MILDHTVATKNLDNFLPLILRVLLHLLFPWLLCWRHRPWCSIKYSFGILLYCKEYTFPNLSSQNKTNQVIVNNIIWFVKIMKIAVFWVVAPWSLVEVYQRSRGPCCLHHHHPDDGGSKDLWNVGKLLPDYTAIQPRRQPSSYSPQCEPQILLMKIIFL